MGNQKAGRRCGRRPRRWTLPVLALGIAGVALGFAPPTAGAAPGPVGGLAAALGGRDDDSNVETQCGPGKPNAFNGCLFVDMVELAVYGKQT